MSSSLEGLADDKTTKCIHYNLCSNQIPRAFTPVVLCYSLKVKVSSERPAFPASLFLHTRHKYGQHPSPSKDTRQVVRPMDGAGFCSWALVTGRSPGYEQQLVRTEGSTGYTHPKPEIKHEDGQHFRAEKRTCRQRQRQAIDGPRDGHIGGGHADDVDSQV